MSDMALLPFVCYAVCSASGEANVVLISQETSPGFRYSRAMWSTRRDTFRALHGWQGAGHQQPAKSRRVSVGVGAGLSRRSITTGGTLRTQP